MRISKLLIITLFLARIFSGLGAEATIATQNPESVIVPTTTLKEAKDFATVYLGDAWDMDRFADISQYLNGAGRHPNLANFKVENGVFSARSTGDYTGGLAFIFPLYYGYNGAMQVGENLGSLHPIDASEFRCIYLAMKVNSPQYQGPSGSQPDHYRVFWHANKVNPPQDGPSGGTYVYLYPETIEYPWNTPVVHRWELQKLDLGNPPHGVYSGGVAWGSQPLWRGLEINPTIYKNVDFEIDWIRLTSCNNSTEFTAQIKWSPNAAIDSIWAKPVGTNREILLVTGINGAQGSYTIDTKGLAPGSYRIGVGKLAADCSSQGNLCQWSASLLKVNQTPTAEFVRPSPYSGEDYATIGGNAWDMDSEGDAAKITCASKSFVEGLLILDTQYPASLPADCRGEGVNEADPKIILNMPQAIANGNQYRFLSFRLNQDGAYQLPADGMIGRWMWTTSGNCVEVSAEIPYDVGWRIYSVDLFDPFQGKPISSAPAGCPLINWWDTGEIKKLRFDPNENWTGNMVPAMVFHQVFDWIRLTKVDQVTAGDPFPIQVRLKPYSGQANRINYFYTDNVNIPMQHNALRYPNSPLPTGLKLLYLPGVFRRSFLDLTGVTTFYWDTAQVISGEYFICVQVSNDLNATVTCSQAPVKVISP